MTEYSRLQVIAAFSFKHERTKTLRLLREKEKNYESPAVLILHILILDVYQIFGILMKLIVGSCYTVLCLYVDNVNSFSIIENVRFGYMSDGCQSLIGCS